MRKKLNSKKFLAYVLGLLLIAFGLSTQIYVIYNIQSILGWGQVLTYIGFVLSVVAFTVLVIAAVMWIGKTLN
jgi:hypothetical protein